MAVVMGDVPACSSAEPDRADQQRAVLNIRRVVAMAQELGVHTLTLYALTPRLWELDSGATQRVLGLYAAYLRGDREALRAAGTRLTVIGRRDRLPEDLQAAIRTAEFRTASCRVARLRIAIDYSARHAFERARLILEAQGVGCTFDEALALAIHDDLPVRPVDLVVIAGGGQESDDALFWESAYAPMVHTPTPWADLDPDTLGRIIRRSVPLGARAGH